MRNGEAELGDAAKREGGGRGAGSSGVAQDKHDAHPNAGRLCGRRRPDRGLRHARRRAPQVTRHSTPVARQVTRGFNSSCSPGGRMFHFSCSPGDPGFHSSCSPGHTPPHNRPPGLPWQNTGRYKTGRRRRTRPASNANQPTRETLSLFVCCHIVKVIGETWRTRLHRENRRVYR